MASQAKRGSEASVMPSLRRPPLPNGPPNPKTYSGSPAVFDQLHGSPFMVYQKQVTIQSLGHGAMHDLTDAVNRIVADSGIQTGLANVFHVGSTGALGTIEFEPG